MFLAIMKKSLIFFLNCSTLLPVIQETGTKGRTKNMNMVIKSISVYNTHDKRYRGTVCTNQLLFRVQNQPVDDFQKEKGPDVIKPKSGKGSCSSSLPWKLVLMFTLKWKTSNYFACNQMFFPALPLIARWTECKAALIIDVCCQARSLSKMRRLSH